MHDGYRKRLAHLFAWRWAPALALILASLGYVLVVLALVPAQLGMPRARSTGSFPAEVATSSAPLTGHDAAAAPVRVESLLAGGTRGEPPAAVVDFGRRGFSPRLERSDPPPPASVSTVNPLAAPPEP